jgi:mRNA-degrading endonuclease RelE of RelBE toxin-antitoxin system
VRFLTLSTFKKDYRRLPTEIQKQVDKALHLFAEDPRHPSLQVKKIRGTENIWEGRLSLAYRFTFNWESDLVTLRRVGTHDILKKESSR